MSGRRNALLAAVAAGTLSPNLGNAQVCATVAQSPDADLVTLCGEIVALEVRINAIVDVCLTIEQEEEADVVADPLRDSQDEMIRRVCMMRAATLAGVQARALIAWAPDYEGKVSSEFLDEKMLGALLRDLQAVAS